MTSSPMELEDILFRHFPDLFWKRTIRATFIGCKSATDICKAASSSSCSQGSKGTMRQRTTRVKLGAVA